MQTIEKPRLRRVKRTFIKKGACSHTTCYFINGFFNNNNEAVERATDPLAGGIIQQGYQCGILWGASVAAGAEAYRRIKNVNKATALTIKATQHIMESFKNRTDYHDCYDITKTDWHKKSNVAKYFATGKFIYCFKLMDKYAPEAIQATFEGLSIDKDLPEKCISCASEVVKRLGGTEEEQVMVAGFAGGMGLSGNACGALAAKIWYTTLLLCKETPGKSFYSNIESQDAIEDFYKQTNYEILCKEITGREFKSIDEHTEYILNGGCGELIEHFIQVRNS